MVRQPFLELRLTGARFEQHGLPLEVLKDLAVIEEMIVEVAKVLYLADHPDRRRTPKGFTDGIEFHLSEIGAGSTKPIIEMVCTDPGDLFPAIGQKYVEKARDAIGRAIDAAEKGEKSTDFLPANVHGYFNRFGRSLRDGEAIEFPATDTRAPKLSRQSRQRLVLASEAVTTITEETSLRGSIPDIAQTKDIFEIQPIYGRKVKAPIPPDIPNLLEAVLEAVAGWKARTRVLVKGIGRFNRHKELLEFESVRDISILDPLDVAARLDELRTLKNGWLDGHGTAPSHRGLTRLAESFDRHYPDELPLPYAYPTESGGIQFEWQFGAQEITVAIDLESGNAEWHSLDHDTDDDRAHSLNLNTPDGWKWLAERIQTLQKVAHE